jgi:hypothetical protein
MRCYVTVTVYIGHMNYYIGYMTYNGGLYECWCQFLGLSVVNVFLFSF